MWNLLTEDLKEHKHGVGEYTGDCVRYEECWRFSRLLCMEMLLKDKWVQHYKFTVVDFSPATVSTQCFDLTKRTEILRRLREFYLGKRSDNIIRWVALHSSGVGDPHYELFRVEMLRLAVKYCLHPLAVQDALDLSNVQAKVDLYHQSLGNIEYKHTPMEWIRPKMPAPVFSNKGHHYFICLPMFRLCGSSLKSFLNHEGQVNVIVERSSIGMFVGGSSAESRAGGIVNSGKNDNIVISMSEYWKPTRICGDDEQMFAENLAQQQTERSPSPHIQCNNNKFNSLNIIYDSSRRIIGRSGRRFSGDFIGLSDPYKTPNTIRVIKHDIKARRFEDFWESIQFIIQKRHSVIGDNKEWMIHGIMDSVVD